MKINHLWIGTLHQHHFTHSIGPSNKVFVRIFLFLFKRLDYILLILFGSTYKNFQCWWYCFQRRISIKNQQVFKISFANKDQSKIFKSLIPCLTCKLCKVIFVKSFSRVFVFHTAADQCFVACHIIAWS